MYKITFSNQLKKDYKRIKKRNYDLKNFDKVYDILEETGTLPKLVYKTHILKGNYKGLYEAHITPDWLIIWEKTPKEIHIVRTGTHSDLF